MQLHSPWILILYLILPVLAWFTRRRIRTAAVKFSSLENMKKCPVSWRLKLRPLMTAVRFICIAFLIFALGRPRKGTVLSEKSTEGVAIELVVDRSSSMGEVMDYYGQKLNRLEVSKKVISDFIKGDNGDLAGRSSDLVGLITFARYPDTKCPLVHTHDALLGFLQKTPLVNLRSEDGTAIGDALALAGARLKKAEEEILQRKIQLGIDDSEIDFNIKSKVIILLTDGVNNAGQYSPVKSAELAKEWGIKIYTIGIGSAERRRGLFGMRMQNNLDERLLKAIAESTGGFYGRANDAKALRQIVEKIDTLEKTKVHSIEYTQFAERFTPFAYSALLLLALEMLSSCTIFRKIP